MKHVSDIFINNGDKVTISSLKDLQKLPDKSIVVLFDNSNYIEVIYLYILHKLDMYLENSAYTEKAREGYFNTCFNIIPTLIQHQECFLAGGQFYSNGVSNVIPKEIEMAHKNCVKNISSFVSGILSTTPYLNNELFPKEKLLFMKHNYGNMLKILDRLFK
ncbi:MAG: hypothetical protein WAW11_02850 [Patescibacteria group bacterium]